MRALLGRSWFIVTTLALLSSLALGVLSAQPSSAIAIGNPPASADLSELERDDKDTETRHEVCGIEGFFGGLMCGFTKFIAGLTDASFAMLSAFLKVAPFTELDSAGNESGTYAAWSLFRGIANGFFVIAFLVIIYAHVSGIGVSNYSIKRMLPRIIVASLLVNLSFYISALAVDLSNILGGTLKELLEAAGNQAISGENGLVNRSNNGGGLDTWSSIAASVLVVGGAGAAVGGAMLYGTFSVFLPLLVSAAIAIVTTVLILMIRQMLIVVFIVLSPLAFAAMILPNTNRYFDKWRTLFIPLLLVYPAVALLYGAGYIASIAIRSAGAGNDAILLSVAALGAQIVPLFLTPAVMKLGSGLIDRWGGISQTPGKAIRKKSEEYAKKLDNRADLRSLSRKGPLALNPRTMARKRRAGLEARDKRIEDTRNIAGEVDLRQAINDTTPTLAASMGFGSNTVGEALQQQMAQSTDAADMGRAKNHVIHAKVKAHSKDVEAKAIQMQNETRYDTLSKAIGASSNVSALEKEAAIMKLASVGDIGAIMDMLKNSQTMTEQQRQTLLTYADKSGASDKMPFLGDSDVRDRILRGDVTPTNFNATVVAAGMASGEVTAIDLATGVDKDALVPMADVVESAVGGDADALKSLGNTSAHDPNRTYSSTEIEDELLRTGRAKLKEYQDTAYQALTTEYTATQIDKNYEPLCKMAKLHLDHEEALVENWFRSRNGSGGTP